MPNPLRIYFDAIKAVTPRGKNGYAKKVEEFAETVGVHPITVRRLMSIKRPETVGPLIALRIELATGGSVPAGSLTKIDMDELFHLVEKVGELRARK